MSDPTTDTGWRDPATGPQQGASRTAGRRWWETLSAHYRLVGVFGLWIAVALIYWPSTEALDGIWRGSAGESYTQGYFVLLASLWLIVRERERLETTPVRPVGWGWVLVLVLSSLWLLSWRASIQALQVLLLPAILGAALIAAMGWRIARISLFPVGLLLFAIPIWDPINGLLQALSARVNGLLIWLWGMPAYMQGHLIQLPGGSIDIAQACAGLNGLLAGMTLAALYGEITRDPLRRRLAWFGLMAILALAANAVRIFVITVAAYETDMRSPLVVHHIWLGWVLFAVAVALFLMIVGRLAEIWDRARASRGRKAPTGQARPEEAPRPVGMRITRLVLAVACLGLLPALSYGMDILEAQARSNLVIDWPEAPQGWRGPMVDSMGDWSPFFVNPSVESRRLYVDSHAEPVEVFAVGYRTQTQDAKLLEYRNALLGSAKRLQVLSQRMVGSPAGQWRETVAVDPSGARSLIWWRYRIGNRTFIRPRLSQLWYGLEALTGRPPLSSLLALRTACGAGCSGARERLASVAARLQPVITSQPATTRGAKER